MGYDDFYNRGFNPCFHGSSSRSISNRDVLDENFFVSILVFMEVALDRFYNIDCEQITLFVSILVFMEVALDRSLDSDFTAMKYGFNPCFHGSSSRSSWRY